MFSNLDGPSARLLPLVRGQNLSQRAWGLCCSRSLINKCPKKLFFKRCGTRLNKCSMLRGSQSTVRSGEIKCMMNWLTSNRGLGGVPRELLAFHTFFIMENYFQFWTYSIGFHYPPICYSIICNCSTLSGHMVEWVQSLTPIFHFLQTTTETKGFI